MRTNQQKGGQCRVSGLTFRYFEESKRNILDHFSAEFPSGAVTVILGSSGCGKSTLSAVMCGLYPENGGYLESGEVTVDGEKVNDMPFGARCRRIAAMFQNPDLQFCMADLREELFFCLENMKVPQEEMAERIDQTAKRYHVENLLDKPFRVMSGGEKQRAALSCLLMEDPSVLVLDEPFANLDSISMKKYLTLLKQKIDDDHTSVIAIDHKAENWLGVADYFLILDEKCQMASIPGSDLPEGFVRAEELFKYRDVLKNLGIQNPFEKVSLKTQRHLSDEKVICLEDVSIYHSKKQQKATPQLQGLDLLAGKGEMVALIGPSGSGKTTLLLSLLGQKCFKGSVRIHGKEMASMKKRELFSKIGIVFQNPSIQFVTTQVRAEIISSLKVWRPSDAAHYEEIADELLESFRLRNYCRYSPFMLSQGQQRRLAVLTMLSGGQDILLLDEPTYGQDGLTTAAIMCEMCERAKQGTTVIFTTHDMKTALRYADRIWQVQEDTIREIEPELLLSSILAERGQLC